MRRAIDDVPETASSYPPRLMIHVKVTSSDSSSPELQVEGLLANCSFRLLPFPQRKGNINILACLLYHACMNLFLHVLTVLVSRDVPAVSSNLKPQLSAENPGNKNNYIGMNVINT